MDPVSEATIPIVTLVGAVGVGVGGGGLVAYQAATPPTTATITTTAIIVQSAVLEMAFLFIILVQGLYMKYFMKFMFALLCCTI